MGKTKERWEKRKTKEESDDAVRMWFGTYFCGCGDPDEAMETFKEVLDWFQPNDDSMFLDLGKLNAFEAKHGKGLALVMLYLLDGTGLTEHGGSVYGSWMTKLGRDMKVFLEENPEYEL